MIFEISIEGITSKTLKIFFKILKNLIYQRIWTSINFCTDIFFMKNILTKGRSNLIVLPEVLTLHYYKPNWWNYSESWFKLNLINIKKYFIIYWFSFSNLINLLYLLMGSFLPLKIKRWLMFKILLKSKIEDKNQLMKNSNYAKMLEYY